MKIEIDKKDLVELQETLEEAQTKIDEISQVIDFYIRLGEDVEELNRSEGK